MPFRVFAVPEVLIWLALGFICILLIFIIFLLVRLFRNIFWDKAIIIDETNRWQLFSVKNLKGEAVEINGKMYFLNKESGLLSVFGKKLFIWSYNKPMPLKIEYNRHSWVSSENLKNAINNELIAQMIKPRNKLLDLLLIIAAAASSFCLIIIIYVAMQASKIPTPIKGG